jgi:hypothetical protein
MYKTLAILVYKYSKRFIQFTRTLQRKYVLEFLAVKKRDSLMYYVISTATLIVLKYVLVVQKLALSYGIPYILYY